MHRESTQSTANAVIQNSQRPTEGRISFSVPGDVPGVETVLRMEDTRSAACYLNACYTLKIIHRSASMVRFRGRTLQGANSLVGLLDPGELVRTSHVSTPERIEGIMIRPEFLTQLADEFGLPSRSLWFRKTLLTHPVLFSRIARFLGSLQAPHTTLERQTLFSDILETVFATTLEVRAGETAPVKVPAVVRRAKELIHARAAEEIALDQLIAETGLSRSQLMRAFTREVGVPPHRYQIHVRVARARALLACGLPPAEVAADVGFYDQSHFIRCFKRIVGITPGRYTGERSRATRSELS